MIKLLDILKELEVNDPNKRWDKELEKIIIDEGLLHLDDSETFEINIDDKLVYHLSKYLIKNNHNPENPYIFEYNNVSFFVYLDYENEYIIIELI